ncbi:hypothetical protein EHI8A_043940 [Entamoeba histolytica HM-1:IMSS-B]|uniref:Uncharacterized protein n=6 Tax=Entamoeba histolytica TaxID=5759 RepID=B1N496_ENTH1|nr:hypothetical protein EHI_036560 [Entamoeba histolytica HM-1:IMSS]EMD44250.1 Hypothetical protein EHI5A_049630 [Entamoeba histolytica KU27]EMH73219.1 hypothetical protein EHI8A_043940 [Entamoeba histolytica HM-1:IMSS-B]EMS16269.1 hypothetical protein KM1_057540 [Entamoeba histolytica HM-3:IMSS]ENY60858.1 hypothetical protein EHI7A_028790 [Entamoeba histolytica HM-1:IMSS-A]GAT97882.1 hypothetical protein CL6EHI_036560 [Entamoeba histolytica]|eukprot:XP_001914012.1 hypothetical protein EHI_036560 [Entamoeba histolytica HM-1:IMSS]
MSLYDNIKFVVLEGAVSSDEPDVSGEYLHNSPIFNYPVANKTKTILEGEKGIKELRAGYLSYWNLINQKKREADNNYFIKNEARIKELK